jgi:hypothetical protein
MEIEYEVLPPCSPEAIAKGCDCPDMGALKLFPHAVMIVGGHAFSIRCPLHRRAVLGQIERDNDGRVQ